MSQSLKIFPYKNNGLVDVKNNRLVNLATPVDDNDAVTKGYVDTALTGANDPEALKTYALVTDDQTIVHPSERSAEYKCAKVNTGYVDPTYTPTALSGGLSGGTSDGRIYAFAQYNGFIYVGGSFLTATNSPSTSISSRYLAIWNPSTQEWSAFPSDPLYEVYRMAIDSQGNVYTINFSGRISKWTASTNTWSTILNDSTKLSLGYAIVVDSNDDVYVGGSNASSAAILKKYISSTNTWVDLESNIGSTASSSIWFIVQSPVNNDLYVGKVAFSSSTVYRYNTSSSTWSQIVGLNASSLGGMVIDSTGLLYVSGNTYVTRYNSTTDTTTSLTYSNQYMPDGSQILGTFANAKRLVVDSEDNVYLSSGGSAYIMKLNHGTTVFYGIRVIRNDALFVYNDILYFGSDLNTPNTYYPTIGNLGKMESITTTVFNMTTILQAPSSYSFVDMNDNTNTLSNITFTTVGDTFKVLYSPYDDTYYIVENTVIA
jgi:hypothetical protein